jgi:putative MATE family efflux protein
MVETKNSPRERAAFGKDWTKGSIIQNLLLLSYPIIILNGLWQVDLILEMIWIGKLGSASIAGVGVASLIVMLMITVKGSLSTGERAMVARFIGSGDVAAANHVAGQAFITSTAFGVISAVIGIFLTEPIINLFGLEVNAAAEGVAYLRIMLIGLVTETFWIASFTIMQSSGDSVTPMKIAIFIRLVNAVLCPFLVLGWWVFPRLGVSGAAIAYIFVMGLAMFICLWILFTGNTRLRLTLRDFRPDFRIIWRLLRIGIPASIMGLGRSFGDLALTRFMTPFGTLAVAAHSLTSRIEMFIRMPGASLGMGAGVLVGQNLGAGQPKRAVRSGWLALGLGEGFIVICSVILMVWAESIIGIFSTDSNLIRLGSIFLRIATAGYLTMYFVYILQNCISGAGDTVLPMVITLAMVWVVQLPLSFLLSRYTDMGMYGVRWAIVISFVVGAIAYTAYFWQGRWRRKKI